MPRTRVTYTITPIPIEPDQEGYTVTTSPVGEPGAFLDQHSVTVRYLPSQARTAYKVVVHGYKDCGRVPSVPEFNWLHDALRSATTLAARCSTALMLSDVSSCNARTLRAWWSGSAELVSALVADVAHGACPVTAPNAGGNGPRHAAVAHISAPTPSDGLPRRDRCSVARRGCG